MQKLIVFAALALVVLAGSSAQATDLDVFSKFMRKFASGGVGERPKALCSCQDGSTVDGAGGYVIATPNSSGITRISVRCVVPTFANDGTFLNNTFCSTFTAIGK